MKRYSFMKDAALTKTSRLHIYSFQANGQQYKIAFTKKRLTRRHKIVCGDGEVSLVRYYPVALAREPVAVSRPLLLPSRFLEKGVDCILVIRGTPLCLSKLDSDGYLSAPARENLMMSPAHSILSVMTSSAFMRLYRMGKIIFGE